RIRFSLKRSVCKYGNGGKSNDDNSFASNLSVNKNFKRLNEIIVQSLSLLAKTGNGLAHAYTRFEATNR
ncbi:unnamed protein product, partial [Adineta steineri]